MKKYIKEKVRYAAYTKLCQENSVKEKIKHIFVKELKIFENRATSLPKISSSKVKKLTQFEVMDQKGQNSHTAQHYKNISKWDHQNLINVKGMLEAKVYSPMQARTSVQSKVYGLTKEQTNIQKSGSKPSLMHSASNRSLF